jgi:hypothetical protein
MMNPGDQIVIHMHDTPQGYSVDLNDVTTHQKGSMTASVKNGFAHILYQPNATTCTSAPYAFHAEYSSADPRGNTWSAHTYNVAYSDEIGHFEHCTTVDANFNCAVAGADDPGGLDDDDGNNFCVPGTDSLLIKINGCFSDDLDFDGPSYKNEWPGTFPNPVLDFLFHPQPLKFTSATTSNGHDNYPRIAFEADLPRIEPTCDRQTGAGCTNPPPGAQFYPFYTTTIDQGTCTWQEGGNYIPGTINHYGGSSTTEFGQLLRTVYPSAGWTTVSFLNNFNSGDLRNGCPVSNNGGHDH